MWRSYSMQPKKRKIRIVPFLFVFVSIVLGGALYTYLNQQYLTILVPNQVIQKGYTITNSDIQPFGKFTYKSVPTTYFSSKEEQFVFLPADASQLVGHTLKFDLVNGTPIFGDYLMDAKMDLLVKKDFEVRTLLASVDFVGLPENTTPLNRINLYVSTQIKANSDFITTPILSDVEIMRVNKSAENKIVSIDISIPKSSIEQFNSALANKKQPLFANVITPIEVTP